jgi:hypothetical protein
MLTPSQRRQVRQRSGVRALSGLNVPVMDTNVTQKKTGRKDVLPRRIKKKPRTMYTVKTLKLPKADA